MSAFEYVSSVTICRTRSDIEMLPRMIQDNCVPGRTQPIS